MILLKHATFTVRAEDEYIVFLSWGRGGGFSKVKTPIRTQYFSSNREFTSEFLQSKDQELDAFVPLKSSQKQNHLTTRFASVFEVFVLKIDEGTFSES